MAKLSDKQVSFLWQCLKRDALSCPQGSRTGASLCRRGLMRVFRQRRRWKIYCLTPEGKRVAREFGKPLGMLEAIERLKEEMKWLGILPR